ncbi:hypothetical protein JOC45_004203 [Gordonia hydrophobica]|nr:hypothetical protein [Gordonia hydrophobica]
MCCRAWGRRASPPVRWPIWFPEQREFAAETNADVAELKSSAGMVAAIDAAVGFYEQPPTETIDVETAWGEVEVTGDDWADVFSAVGGRTVHNEARDELWDALADVLTVKIQTTTGADVAAERVRAEVGADPELKAAIGRAWPLLDPTETVADLWAVPAYLRLCAPWLTAEQAALLRRPEGTAFTTADLPLLDTARRRLGDPEAARQRQRRLVEIGEQRRVRARVVDELIAGDDGEGLVTMLRSEDIDGVLVDETGMAASDADPLAGPFAHIVVDEAQDLTDAQWQMLLARCPSRSFTIVGDRAQARSGFPETWEERLQRVGVGALRRTTLTVNYRTPIEVMEVARPGILEALPGVAVPESIRATGVPVSFRAMSDQAAVLADWAEANEEGTACVIGAPQFPGDHRVASLSPSAAKGLEFDLVVLVDPAQFGADVAGAVDRYVAMTRTTSQLVVLSPDSGGPSRSIGSRRPGR